MKKILLLFIVALFARGVNAQWQTNGPDSTTVECLGVSGTNIFAGTVGKGIFLSTDSGGSWAAVNSGLPYHTFTYVSSISVSGSNIFAGTVSGGVFLSANNGGNWTAVNSGLTNTTVYSLAVSGSYIFAGTAGGVFVSNNNGGSWSAANSGLNGNVGSFAVNGSTIFAGTPSGVFSSSNNGGSWSAALDTGLYGTPIYSLAVNGNQLYAGTRDAGVFLSYNNGSNWTQIASGLDTAAYISSIVIFNDTNILASVYGGGVFLITTTDIDSGFNGWTQLGENLNNFGVSCLAVTGNYIFAGTGGGGVWQLPLYSIIFDAVQEISQAAKSDFSLYPNPNSVGSVQCVISSALSNSKIKIYDIAGQLVLSQPIEDTKTTIDISSLAAGVYMVSLKSDGGIASQKLVITK